MYRYRLVSISKKYSLFKLIDYSQKIVENTKKLHIGWCIIDTKEIQKHIHILNELGVAKITFIRCDFSQDYKINVDKLIKILINSSMQCGRSSIIQIDFCDSLEDFKKKYPYAKMLHFSKKIISQDMNINEIVIGCEGGFSKQEIELFSDEIVGIKSNLILRSESAAIYSASVLL